MTADSATARSATAGLDGEGLGPAMDRRTVLKSVAATLALAGAEYIVNPSATVAGVSEYLWKLEQPASAVANGVFIGATNRVGTEAPWNIGEFYGQSYFVNPRGEIEAIASRDKDELLVHDMDMNMVREIRNNWQFFRDRRPETYGTLVDLN